MRIANPPTPVRFRPRPPLSKAPQPLGCGAFFVPADFVPAVNWDNPGTLRSFNGGTVLAAHWSLAKTSACSPLSSAVAGVNPPSYACHSATSFPCGPMCSLPMTEMAISVLCFRDRRTGCTNTSLPRGRLWKKWSFMLPGCEE